MKEITIGSYIRLKKTPTQIYKVFDIDCEGQSIDAIQKNGYRLILDVSEVELGSDDDMLLYESNTQIEYYRLFKIAICCLNSSFQTIFHLGAGR